MKTKLRFFLFSLLAMVSLNITHAQKLSIPDIKSFQKASEYRSYEAEALRMINWLMTRESLEDKTKRKKVLQFVNSFAENHPYLIYNPEKSVTKMRRKSEYQLQFKLAWIQYLLSYEYSKNRLENHSRAFDHVLSFYKNHKNTFGKSSYLEKLEKMKVAGTLKKFIKSEI